MTSLATILKTYWWLIPLGMMVPCIFSTGRIGFLGGMGKEHRPGESTLDNLDRRYASGEIGPIEYEDKILTMGLKNLR